MRARAVAEARLDAQRLLVATRSALAADADLLDAVQQAALQASMQTVQGALEADDPVAIEAATRALAAATEPFAAMRMNRGIAQALAGRNIENV